MIRFFEFSISRRTVLRLLKDGAAVSWKAIAKDGADLPPAEATVQPAVVMMNTGETFDFEWTPKPGDYILDAPSPDDAPLFTLAIPCAKEFGVPSVLELHYL